jgi:hypothetical protein
VEEIALKRNSQNIESYSRSPAQTFDMPLCLPRIHSASRMWRLSHAPYRHSPSALWRRQSSKAGHYSQFFFRLHLYRCRLPAFARIAVLI